MCLLELNKQEAIEELRGISGILRDFYDDMPNVIRENLRYYRRSIPEENVQLIQCATNSKNGNHILIFDNDDIDEVRDSIIAHELKHILMRSEGFPFTTPVGETTQHLKLSEGINNLLQHKFIYDSLMSLGFNVERDYREIAFEKFKNLIGFADDDPIVLSNIGSKIFTLLFADQYNIQNTIFDDFYDDNEVSDFIHDHYNIIHRRANRLLNRMERNSYDSPEEQINSLRDLVSRHSLNRAVSGYYIENSDVQSINFNN